MLKIPKQMVTAEFKVVVIQQIKDGQIIAGVVRGLGKSRVATQLDKSRGIRQAQ